MNNNKLTKVLRDIREKNPLIHHITNEVVMNFTANGLLAFGGSPIMAKEYKEMNEISQKVDGLLLNIGTMTQDELHSMIKAGNLANKNQIPVVLDPVGIAVSSFRNKVVKELLTNINFTAIKGNAGEMAHLVNIPWQTKGVESIDDDLGKLKDIAQKVAYTFQTIAIVTGEIDVISDGDVTLTNKTGHIYLTKITGAGCLLGSIVTACLTTNASKINAAHAGVSFYGKAAEQAARQNNVFGTGTFLPHFIDALGGIS